jgi:hypothetical protein
MNSQRRLFKTLESHGWAVGITNGNHYKLIPPHEDMKLIIASYTSSDHRALSNIKADVRRAYRSTNRESPV